MPDCPPLTGDFEADVCVVGAGIAGLTTAYLLGREGKSVVVLDDGPLAGGMTQQTTAHLTHAIDDRFQAVAKVRGEAGARLAAESHTAAIDRIEAIVRDEGISCGFERVDGYLFLGPDQKSSILDDELEAAHRSGLTRVHRVERAPWAAYDSGPALRFPQQGQFHPLEYLSHVAAAVTRQGGRLFARSHADEVEDGEPAMVRSGKRTVRARDVVVATNAPINDRVAIHSKQAPYMTYVIAAPVPPRILDRALYWDSLDPYHYIRTQTVGDARGERTFVIVGGEDHKSGHGSGDEAYPRLETWARERFPGMGAVEFAWGGQVMETVDGLAFIGRNPGDDHVFVVTGDSGMGITHGTIAGILLTDLIQGREHPWAELYDPSRKPLRAAGTYVQSAAGMVAEYARWVTGGDVENLDEIAPDGGAVVRRGLHKVAAYRDPSGTLHLRSAVCTHLGCIVGWNDTEKTWDCPCHGSRYDRFGEVVNGPANRALEPWKDDEDSV
jgi:glycine/D-amino acid oxidase-like deaminating enzyme/nitrite reductase/ring-hydroxylating ferredoxin subunit